MIVARLFALVLVWSNRRVAARVERLAHLSNYLDRTGLGRLPDFDGTSSVGPIGQGNPAEVALGHLVHFEADRTSDWRQRDDFRDLPEPVRSEVEAWILEQVLRYSRAVELRADGADEWRRALSLVEREAQRASFSPLRTEQRRLAHRLGLARSSQGSTATHSAVGRAQPWIEEYLKGVESELDGGRPDDELSHFDAALKNRPDSFWAHYRAAAVTYRLGKFAVEAVHLQCCIDLRPNNAQLRVQIAGCLSLLGRHVEALDACDKAISIDPNQPEAFFARAFIRKQLGQDAGRAADLQRFELLARRHNKDLRGRLRLDLMLDQDRQNDSTAKIELARKILEIDPEHIDARVMLADGLGRSKKLPEAVDELGKILVLNPDHLWARYTRGLDLCWLGRDDGARDFAVLASITLDSSNSSATARPQSPRLRFWPIFKSRQETTPRPLRPPSAAWRAPRIRARIRARRTTCSPAPTPLPRKRIPRSSPKVGEQLKRGHLPHTRICRPLPRAKH